jgi:uncharacterized protein involved in exopolysaccharide biosynthesis/Mrp family chromosome partitioning ATPase
MTEIRRDIQHHSSIQLSDILFALFKRKWTIIVCALLGIIAAAAVNHFYPAGYQSEAKLLVRYVLDRSAVDSVDKTTTANQQSGGNSGKSVDTVIDSEVQILTSWDLAAEVAKTIGPKATAGRIASGLQVTSSKGSDVILVSYEDPDPQIAPLVLQELLNRYFVKHLEVHRSAGAFDFVTQQTDQVRARLNQTEDALKALRDKTGIISLKDGLDALASDRAKTKEQLDAAESDLLEQQALATQMGKSKPKQWRPTTSTSEKTVDSVKAQVAGTQAKVEALKTRLRDIQQRTNQLSDLAPQIQELERRHEMDEANYKYFQASLEKARVDEALDPSKMPNISAVQRPSPPILDTKMRNKVALGLAGGGIALGVALALLRGLFFNRTVGRPLQMETRLHIPLMLSIPYSKSSRNGHLALPTNGSQASPGALATKRHNSKLAPWEPGHFMRPYSEAIRDRLGLYFELNHLTHRPKLVGVAGFSDKAGASTLAAGLAASLSETNDGKVLLVDVNLGPEEVHSFFKGKPAYPLNAALKPEEKIASAADNLYLATVGSRNASGPAQVGLKKFFDMIPNLKKSDFDYIIFDMPSLNQTSPSWGMAAFMDKLLLVVEAERNNRDLISRGYRKLVEERDNVAIVVNKTRSYVPKWLDSGS